MARGVVKNLTDSTIKLQDNGGTNSITIAVEEGDLSYSAQQPVDNIKDRGSLSSMRKGEEEPVTGNFSVHHVQLLKASGDSLPELQEVLSFTGGAAGWVSTNDDRGDVKTVDMLFETVNPDATLENERVTFSKVHFLSWDFEEGRPDSFKVEFQAYQTRPTIAKYS